MEYRDVILFAMAEAEKKAWEALSGYKFFMFGYHASQWVKCNQLLQERRHDNPFADAVKLGRTKVDSWSEEPKINSGAE